MKLTIAVAALFSSVSATECKKGLTVKSFTDDKCKTPVTDKKL